MATKSERAMTATLETGGAHALATVALHYLDGDDEEQLHLQVAAHLLSEAAKLADHAALCRRLSREAP